MKGDLFIIDCWNTLFYTDLPEHHFKVFFETLGLDFGNYENLKAFEEVFFLQKQMEYESAVHLFCEKNKIFSYDVYSLSKLLYDGLTHNNCYYDTMNFLKRINQKGKKLCILSNTDLLSWRSLNKEYNLNQYFDLCITSYNTGLMKPNPKVFQMACDICGVDKSNAVMIGDSYKDDYLPSKDFGIGRSYLLNRKGGDGFKSLNDIYDDIFA